MYEGEVQSVLRCGQCNKPFDKQSTLKRHGYYCRSRKGGDTTRSRSCISCARGKARCDNRRPECSRCITKAIECHYPATTAKAIGPRIPHGDHAPTERRRIPPSLVSDSPGFANGHEASNDSDIILNTALAISNTEFTNLGGEYLDWGDPDINFADFLDSQTNGETVQYPSPRSSLARHSTPPLNQSIQIQQAMSSPSLSIPRLPTYTPRSLVQRPKIRTGAQRTASLIFHTLKSYPQMIMRHNALPPFIHPHAVSSDIENSHVEPLTNCISLVHMISSGVHGSRRLFWKNVRMECERLREEHLKLNKWELLAAMQALSIYIIIRLDEGETDHNDLDFQLIATVIVMAKRSTASDVTNATLSTLRNSGLEISWEDWIFKEAGRRLCIVYQVVNMLVYFEPASMCDLQRGLVLAPLPAKKQLWEASDMFVWKAENEREVGDQTVFGLASDGELVEVDEGRVYCGDSMLLHEPSDARRRTANWAEWCSGMDGLGGLVMLAASLVG